MFSAADGDDDEDDEDGDDDNRHRDETHKAAASTPTGPRLAGHQNARGATPDLCLPFGLVAGPKRRAVL